MKMGHGQFMILEDSRGQVAAVIKSRCTHVPSMVVYSTKRRFDGQVPSGHRLTRQVIGAGSGSGDNDAHANGGSARARKSMAVVIDENNNHGMFMEGEPLYPWALISKSGRTMEDDCMVHLVNDEKVGKKGSAGTGSYSSSSSSSSFGGIFHAKPSFCGRHGFDRELHTHTVVSRTMATPCEETSMDSGIGGNTNTNSSVSLEEAVLPSVPCCVIVRDPSNYDAVDITIAPGIDPLLMICYLASHAKMDVEPLMSGF